MSGLVTLIQQNWNKTRLTLALKLSLTVVADPVQLMRMRPTVRWGWARPNLASTLAPAPSPSPITYFTFTKSNTVANSSPNVCSDGNWKLETKKLVRLESLELGWTPWMRVHQELTKRESFLPHRLIENFRKVVLRRLCLMFLSSFGIFAAVFYSHPVFFNYCTNLSIFHICLQIYKILFLIISFIGMELVLEWVSLLKANLFLYLRSHH